MAIRQTFLSLEAEMHINPQAEGPTGPKIHIGDFILRRERGWCG